MNQYISQYVVFEWKTWDKDKPPSEDDYAFVAFRNLVSGEKWVQAHAIIEGQFWYDNEPSAWLPREAWPKPPKLYEKSKVE